MDRPWYPLFKACSYIHRLIIYLCKLRYKFSPSYNFFNSQSVNTRSNINLFQNFHSVKKARDQVNYCTELVTTSNVDVPRASARAPSRGRPWGRGWDMLCNEYITVFSFVSYFHGTSPTCYHNHKSFSQSSWPTLTTQDLLRLLYHGWIFRGGGGHCLSLGKVGTNFLQIQAIIKNNWNLINNAILATGDTSASWWTGLSACIY